MTIKYTTRMGDSSEEFQFDNVDEMIRYFDYVKYDVKMDEDFCGDDPRLSISYQQKTLDNNDKNILKEAFDKIGILYQDNGDYLTVKQSDLLDAERIDINFNDTKNYKFLNFELMD